MSLFWTIFSVWLLDANVSSVVKENGSPKRSQQVLRKPSDFLYSLNRGNEPRSLWPFKVYSQVYQLSKFARKYVEKKILLVVPTIFLMLLGFTPVPSSIPLLKIAKHSALPHRLLERYCWWFLWTRCLFHFCQSHEEKMVTISLNPARDGAFGHWLATGISTASFVISSALLKTTDGQS